MLWRQAALKPDLLVFAIVTQCFGPDLGGVEALMTGLADALAAAGEEIAVFADRPHLSDAFARPYPIERFGFIRPFRRLMKRRAIVRAAATGRLAGIFADSWKSVEAIPPIAAPIVVLAHGMELPPDAPRRKARRIAAAFGRAQTIVANSAYTADLARNFVKDGAPALAVAPPPIPPQSEPTAQALGQIDALIARRGPVLAMIAAFPRAVYLIGGAGADLNRLRRLAASLGVAEAVHFLGRIDEAQKAALLARADLFAMPTRREGASVEGYGIAYIEAAWRGAPALAGRAGGAADAVIDGETGLLCDGADDRDVTSALLRLLRDEPLRKRLGVAARARARGELSWPAALPRYLAALGR